MTADLPLPTVEGVHTFWMRVRTAKRRFLALDYDGTLAPFKVERMEAKPLPGTVQLLSMIAEVADTRVAVVSGRPLAELLELLGPLRVEMVGEHGFEFRNTDGRIRQTLPDRPQLAGLDAAQRQAVRAGYESRIERKIASVAFHTRGIPEGAEASQAAQRLWLPIAEKHGLSLKDFNGGVELRATGSNKGTALLDMLLSEPDHTLIVYVGDDETDEDAFRAISGRGIGVKVGGYGIRTAANGRLPRPEAVLDFLRAWYRVTRNRQGKEERS